MSSTVSSSKRERGISLETLKLKTASSSVQGRISWVAWSCGGKLRVPLEFRVDLGEPTRVSSGNQISLGVARATSGFLLQCCRDE